MGTVAGAKDMAGAKEILHHALSTARTALVWKLDGLSDYDVRRPLTPTGTNLLGLVKHVASVELGYLSVVFERPTDIATPWMGPAAEPNADMWATPEESRQDIVGLYERVWAHSDATIAELDLDAPGRVPWWGEHGHVTLQLILVHLIAETHRHAGHADIVRELIDGAAGLRPDNDNLWVGDAGWEAHRARLESAAATFRSDS